MEWFWINWSMYRRVFTRAADLAMRNWWVLVTLFAYSLIMTFGAIFAGMLGMAGGFLLGLIKAACIGSFLYLVEMMVRTSCVTVDDFRSSIGAYLWDVVGALFVLWVFSLLVVPALRQMPQGYALLLCVNLAAFVLFNAVPELVYLGHHSLSQLFAESFSFISNNWVEWFPANLVAFAIVYFVSVLPLTGPLLYAGLAAVNLLVYFTMVMRGLLFQELYRTSRRGRTFRYRSES